MARFTGGIGNWSDADVLAAQVDPKNPQADPNEWNQAGAEAQRRGLKTGLLSKAGAGPAPTVTTFTDPATDPSGIPPPVDPGPQAGPAPPPAPPPAPAANPAASTDTSAVSTPDTRSATRDYLMSQLGALSGPTDASSPTIAPAIGAFNTQSARDEQAARDAIAERAYATGDLNTGGFNTNVERNRESAALGRATNAGNLVYQEAQNKRSQLAQLLQTATSAGLTQQAQELQLQIAKIDADLRAKGLSQQNEQFYSGLSQQDKQFYSGLSQQQRLALLTAGLTAKGLDQNQAQFLASQALTKELAGGQLGFLYSQLQAGMNRDALLAGLNG